MRLFDGSKTFRKKATAFVPDNALLLCPWRFGRSFGMVGKYIWHVRFAPSIVVRASALVRHCKCVWHMGHGWYVTSRMSRHACHGARLSGSRDIQAHVYGHTWHSLTLARTCLQGALLKLKISGLLWGPRICFLFTLICSETALANKIRNGFIIGSYLMPSILSDKGAHQPPYCIVLLDLVLFLRK